MSLSYNPSQSTTVTVRLQEQEILKMLTYCRETLALCPPSHPNRSSSFVLLATQLIQ